MLLGSNPSTVRLWRERLARFDAAGLTVAAFCRRENFSQASFYYWRKKFRDASQETNALPASERTSRGDSSPAFRAVEVVSPPSGDHPPRTGPQAVIRFGAAIEMELSLADDRDLRALELVTEKLLRAGGVRAGQVPRDNTSGGASC